MAGTTGGLIDLDPTTPAGLDELFRAHRAELFRLARLLTGSDAIAEEAVQDAFLRFQRSGRAPDNPPAYLRTITANLCRDHLRRRHLERRLPPPVPLSVVNPEVDEMWQVLRRLPFRQRAALVLRFYEDRPEAEIAEILHCRVGTVKSTIHRGLARLRRELSA